MKLGSRYSLLGLMLTTAMTGPALAADTLDNLGLAVPGFGIEQITGISADGKHFSAAGYVQSGRNAGFYGNSQGVVEIGTFGDDTMAIDVSNSGVVVGYGRGVVPYRAFRWTAADGLTALGTLEPGNAMAQSFGMSVSDDGTRIVGRSDTPDHMGYQAFLWVMGATAGIAGNEQMFVLDSLEAGRPSSALAISGNGRFAVGSSAAAGVSTRAALWSLDGVAEGGAATPLDLGTLGGPLSQATGVSNDGLVVVGWADAGGPEAFRWVKGGTGGPVGNPQMQSLGLLDGGNFSEASAVSGDGTVVVGHGDDADNLQHAFRWTEGTGMITLADWLAANGVDIGTVRLERANAVSDDGNVVGGSMFAGGNHVAYIARVGTVTPSGLMEVAEYTNSLLSGARLAQMGVDLTWLPMNGAHHRPLMAQGRVADDACLWSVSDLAGRDGGGMALAEAGACGVLGDGSVTAGLGIGGSTTWQDLSLGGNARLGGAYVVGEVDWQPDGTPLLLSLTGMLGGWEANVSRAYSNGAATDISTGSTAVGAGMVRARLDWQDALVFSKVSINPWVSASIGRTDIGGYTEQGGAFPAQFNAQQIVQSEVRLGVTGVAELTPQTTLSGTLEVAHRSGTAPAANGQVAGLFDFGLGGGNFGSTWARAGLDLDHQLTDTVSISGSLHAATQGQDANVSGSLGLKAVF